MLNTKNEFSCGWCGGSGDECGCGAGHCDHCGGTGKQVGAPFGDGKNAKMSQSVMSKLATKVTELRLIGTPELVQMVAQKASGRDLPASVVLSYVEYWADSRRNATLGEYILQIAECAESDLHDASTSWR